MLIKRDKIKRTNGIYSESYTRWKNELMTVVILLDIHYIRNGASETYENLSNRNVYDISDKKNGK